MKFFVSIFLTLGLFATTLTAQERAISVSGNLGWAIPNGSGVGEAAEDLNLDGGLVYGVDVLYHLKPKVLVGVNYTAAILAGAGGGDVDLFGARMIGAKAVYQLREEGFRPFVGLSLGVAQLLTPEFTITDADGNQVTVPENTGSGLGVMPEFGLQFDNGLYFMGQYLLPTSYTITDVVEDKAMGTLNIQVGWRYTLDF